jgi:hypothetical protein
VALTITQADWNHPVRWRDDLLLPGTFGFIERHPKLSLTIEMTVRVRQGDLLCHTLTVTTDDDTQSISARQLRLLSLPYLLEKAALSLCWQGTPNDGYEPAFGVGDEFEVRARSGLTAPGRPPLDDQHFADVAERYRRAVKNGAANRKAAVTAVSHDPQWGRLVPYKTADRWVRKATNRGLIVIDTKQEEGE